MMKRFSYHHALIYRNVKTYKGVKNRAPHLTFMKGISIIQNSEANFNSQLVKINTFPFILIFSMTGCFSPNPTATAYLSVPRPRRSHANVHLPPPTDGRAPRWEMG